MAQNRCVLLGVTGACVHVWYWMAQNRCVLLGGWCLCACVLLDGPKQMRAIGWLVLVCMYGIGWPKTDACYWVAGACVHVWFCLSKTDACYWGSLVLVCMYGFVCPKQMRAIGDNWCLCACVLLDGSKQMRAIGWPITHTDNRCSTICVAAWFDAVLRLRGSAAQCSTVQHSAAQCSTVQHSEHSAAQCSTVQHSAAQCSKVQHSAAQCSTVQQSAAQCSTMQHSAAQCSTVQAE